MKIVIQKTPRMWSDINLENNPFQAFASILSPLGISADTALLYFSIDYDDATTLYNDGYINYIFSMVFESNHIKYQKLLTAATTEYDPIQNYNSTEEYTDIRTPDLTSVSEGSSSSDGTISNNQTKTTTETPSNYGEISTREVAPYDDSGLRQESKNTTLQTGNRQVAESYSGNPDTTHSESEAKNVTTQTGTETFHHEMTRRGNIGVTTSQQMLESEITLAQKMNIFKIIEKDLAEKLFLKVWL